MTGRLHPLRLFTVLLLFAWAAGAGAAVIERVVIRSATPEVAPPDELITATIACAPDAPFEARQLADDIKRLYQTGFFADVQSAVSETSPGRVTITFTVTLKPRVNSIRFEGGQAFSDKKMRRRLTLTEGAVYDEVRVLEDLNTLRKMYSDKGYYQTEVVSTAESTGPGNDVALVYRITEEPRLKVRRVLFRGNTVFSQKELRGHMQTRHRFWSRLFRVGYFSQEQLRSDLDVIYELYTSRGYLDFKTVDVARQEDDGWTTVTITVLEGEPYTVSNLAVAGNTRFTAEELLAQVRLTLNQPFDAAKERASVDRIRAKYEPLGYIDLRVLPRHQEDPATHTLQVTFDIAEGVPARVRDVLITGNEVTRDAVIRRELAILPGDLANAGLIRASRNRLMDMDYFERVDALPQATEKEEEKDIVFDLAEKPTGQLMLGVGISSTDSLAGYIEVGQKNFDWRNWPTFRGGGQRLRMRLQIGTEYQDVLVAFTEPWFRDHPLRFDWDLFARERSQEYYVEQHVGTRVMFTKPLQWDAPAGSEISRWRHGLGYRLELATLSDFDDNTAQWVQDEDGDYVVSGALYRISRNTTDRTRNPTRGSRLDLSAELDPELLGSYSTLYRLNAEASKYWPVHKSVFKLEAELGVVDSLAGDDPVLFDRYFAGGLGSIRGFDRREVGPVDRPGSDKAVGGGSILRATAEWTFPIYKIVRGSLFCDAGNVWWDPYAWNPFEINAAVGAGIQLDLPIGAPVQLYYGIPFLTDQDHIDGGGRFDFNIGYFF